MTGVGFKECCYFLFLSFNDLYNLEVVLEGLTSHWVVVVNSCTTSCKERKVALTTSNVDRSAEIECVRVTNSTSKFIDADGFNLCCILFAVCVSRSEFEINVLVDLSREECFFKTRNQGTGANYTNHRLVGTVFVMHFMLLRRGFTGGFNQIACFAIVEVIINVNNVAFFHVSSPECFGDSQGVDKSIG